MQDHFIKWLEEQPLVVVSSRAMQTKSTKIIIITLSNNEEITIVEGGMFVSYNNGYYSQCSIDSNQLMVVKKLLMKATKIELNKVRAALSW